MTNKQVQFRYDTAANLAAATPAVAEPAFTSDTKEFYIGDGSTAGGLRLSKAAGFATTATAAGTTTLTAASARNQTFTGTTTQTVVLPVVSTLIAGHSFRIVNNSTGNVTVQSSGANTILVLAPGTEVEFICILITGTTAASWQGLTRYAGLPIRPYSAARTLDITDVNCAILHPAADTTARTWTIDSNANLALPIGSFFTFINQNAGGVITIAITSDTMRLSSAGTTGNRSLAANGVATAVKITTTEWIISGSGLT